MFFFKVSVEPSSLEDQSGDKSKGAPSKDDDKGAKDDDKASKDDGNNRDDGKQGKHTFLSVQQQFLYQHFWLNQQLGLNYSATYDFA